MNASEGTCVQLELDFGDTPSFADVLARRRIANVAVTPTKRLRRGWNAKLDRFTGARTVFVPFFLEDAPEDVKESVVDWALLLPSRSRRPDRRRRELERRVFSYITQHGPVLRNRSSVDPSSHRSAGLYYDLAEVFDSVNKAYFGGAIASYVRWGMHFLRSFQSVRVGPDGTPYNLITIASMYNRAAVPRFAVEGIMYHEMLHIACPPRRLKDRNVIHGPEFKTRERMFPGYHDWIAWEKQACKRISWSY